MNKFFIFLAVFLAIFHKKLRVLSAEDDFSSSPSYLVKLDGIANISLPVSANYRRIVQNAKYVEEEHLYRVCNGKNKAKCGFWENVKTKKKVASGATSYNKNRKVLIVRKIQQNDFGVYMTGNKKKAVNVIKLIVKG